jgi:YD repeat-containing protein
MKPFLRFRYRLLSEAPALAAVWLLLLFAIVLSLPVTTSAATISFSHDSAGRLIGVNYDGAANTAYTYDHNGNLLARVSTDNSFLPLLGKYTGLVQGATADLESTGFITLSVAANGSFSGKLILGGKIFRLRGVFDPEGSATLQLADGITLELALDLDDGNEQITGELSGSVTADLLAERTAFNRKTNPPPGSAVGRFTALFQPTSANAGIPQGDGIATVTVDTRGNVRLAGRLADGARVTLGAGLSSEAEWPLFAMLYKNQGFIAGTVAFDSDPGVSEFAGTLDWLKPDTAGPVHPDAFVTELSLIGSRYSQPPKGTRVLNFANAPPNASFHADGGNLAAPLDKAITLEITNRFSIPAGAEKLTLKLKLPTGMLGGSFIDNGRKRTIQGVIFQEQNRGSGFFLGTSESGSIELDSSP